MRTASAPARPPEAQEKPVTARWSWPPIAAVVLPALALLIVLLA